MLREQLLRRVFRIAAVYNVCWGTAVVLYPNLFVRIFGLPPINYPFVMSGLGMCIGLYGYGSPVTNYVDQRVQRSDLAAVLHRVLRLVPEEPCCIANC